MHLPYLNHNASESLLVAQGGVALSAALHPVPVCVCLCVCVCVCVPHRHLTHRLPLFSLGRLVFRVTHASCERCGTTRVLLHCLPPGHVSLCACMCFCVCVSEEDKTDMITTLEQHKKTRHWPL